MAAFDGGVLINLTTGGVGAPGCINSEAWLHTNAIQMRRFSQHQCLTLVCCTADKSVITTGTRRQLAERLGVTRPAIYQALKGGQQAAFSPVLHKHLYFCVADDFETFVPTPISNTQRQAHRLMIALCLHTYDVVAGTAREIVDYIGVGSPRNLHKVCRGENHTANGWVACYAED